MKIKEGDKIPNSEFYHLDQTGAPKKIFLTSKSHVQLLKVEENESEQNAI